MLLRKTSSPVVSSPLSASVDIYSVITLATNIVTKNTVMYFVSCSLSFHLLFVQVLMSLDLLFLACYHACSYKTKKGEAITRPKHIFQFVSGFYLSQVRRIPEHPQQHDECPLHHHILQSI